MRTRLSISFAIAICAGLSAVPLHSTATRPARLSERSSRLFDRCMIKADIYSREQNRCSFAEMKRQAHLTRRAYRAAWNRAGAHDRRLLAVSQRVWKRDIDRKCHTKELFGPTFLGTIEIDEYLSCLSIENMERMAWLERQYRNPTLHRTHSRRMPNGNRRATGPRKI